MSAPEQPKGIFAECPDPLQVKGRNLTDREAILVALCQNWGSCEELSEPVMCAFLCLQLEHPAKALGMAQTNARLMSHREPENYSKFNCMLDNYERHGHDDTMGRTEHEDEKKWDESRMKDMGCPYRRPLINKEHPCALPAGQVPPCMIVKEEQP